MHTLLIVALAMMAALWLLDVALYTVFSVRHPGILILVYGRSGKRTKGLRAVPGRVHRKVRGSCAVFLVESPYEDSQFDRREYVSAETLDPTVAGYAYRQTHPGP